MKWYWHVPLVNIFFIEEYANWAMENKQQTEFINSMVADLLIVILTIIVLI
jgi:hypothetical protein